MAKGDLEKYLELRIKECDTLKNAAKDYKDLELYGEIGRASCRERVFYSV